MKEDAQLNEMIFSRWNVLNNVSPGNLFLRKGRFRAELSPFGRFNGRWDFRGCHFSSGDFRFIQNSKLTDVDFSESDFSHVRVGHCVLNNVLFENAKFADSNIADSDLFNCVFTSCSIVWSSLGVKTYPSSFIDKITGTSKIVRYQDCVFEKCKLKNTSFSRASFFNCKFLNNQFKRTDFGVSSFDNCLFTGKVEDVTFRGDDDPFDIYLNKSSVLPNPMKVSFENAELLSVEYSFNCDLSKVVMPLTGNYVRINDLGKRLNHALSVISQWSESENKNKLIQKIEMDLQIQTAKKQFWTIINIDELCNIMGNDMAHEYITLLQG